MLENNIAKKTKHSCRRRRLIKISIWWVIFESEKFGVKKGCFGNWAQELQTRERKILERKERRAWEAKIRDSRRKNWWKEVFRELGQKSKTKIRKFRQRTANKEKIIRKRNFWLKGSIWRSEIKTFSWRKEVKNKQKFRRNHLNRSNPYLRPDDGG